VIFPNQHRTPLTPDERLAQLYQDKPRRLLELAQASGNKALAAIARNMPRKPPKNK
jgi:hypothetical protein